MVNIDCIVLTSFKILYYKRITRITRRLDSSERVLRTDIREVPSSNLGWVEPTDLVIPHVETLILFFLFCYRQQRQK